VGLGANRVTMDMGAAPRILRADQNRESAMTELQAVRWGPADGGAARQLVVLCHGLGADGRDLIDLAPHWGAALPHAAFAAPDGPQPCDMGPTGRQWFSLADRTPALVAAGVAQASPTLDAFIDAELARLGLPATAYALMGFSQGAMMVLYTGLRRSTAPRAILAYSGALVAPERLAADRKNAAPVLLVHGEADGVVEVTRSRAAAEALRAAGIPLQTHYIPGLDHGIDQVGLAVGAAFLQTAFA
jgi:phospholipase/carboxylesterase